MTDHSTPSPERSPGSRRPSVLVTGRVPAVVINRLQGAGEVHAHNGPPLSPDELRERVRKQDALLALLTDRVDREVIDAGAPTLRIIANIAVGYDNVDVPYANERGIVVTNTPDVLTEAVAEFTWGLILAAARRITEGDRLVRRGGWKGWGLDFMLGTGLDGKQLGIVGCGRIGRAVAARAPAFGMRVVCAAGGRSSVTGPVRIGDLEVPRVSLDELLVRSDVVSLHTPLTDTTRHLIDQRALARMKRTAVLVNTARGQVVDEAALAWALKEGLLAGAALDVYEREPQVHEELLSLENVVLVPHLGSATRETRTAMADLAARNILAVLAGEPPITPVRPQQR